MLAFAILEVLTMPLAVRNGMPFHLATKFSSVEKSGWRASKIFFFGFS